MRYGVAVGLLDPGHLRDVVVLAEQLGYDSIWVGEHVAVPEQFDSSYPYATLPATAGGSESYSRHPFLDPYAVLAFVSALSERIRVVLGVSVVPLHDPHHLARSVMTLDVLSGGRFTFGIGSGWLREEFEVLGRDWASRGRRLDETLDAMEMLWSDQVMPFRGETITMPKMGFEPKPLTTPRPPFLFGGHSTAALRRAALRGDAWFGVSLSPSEVAPIVAELRQRRAQTARAAEPVEITVVLREPVVDAERVRGYEEAGVSRLVIRVGHVTEPLGVLRRFASGARL